MKYKVWAEYIDTCLSCYLQDSYTREGELLLCTVPYCQTISEAAQELIDSEHTWDGFPEEIEDEELLRALKETLKGVDLRYIDEDGNRLDQVPEEDDSGDMPYVYVVLKWEKEDE